MADTEETDMREPQPIPPTAERTVDESVLATLAAHAALGTPGVVRLEPGLAGLLRQVTRVGGRLAGTATPAAGVTVRYDGDIPVIHLDVVISGERQAAAVGVATQRAVADAVTANTGVPEPVVTVSILDIELGARARVWP
jgi:uncharacterized alkaline shock family protein YloU